jgi:hypothetical protein
MDTTDLTEVQHGTGAGLRRGVIAGVVGVSLFAAIAVGVQATRASTPATTPAWVEVSVEPGRTQPATEIHRLSMRPIPARNH